jgi:hypothetical protein
VTVTSFASPFRRSRFRRLRPTNPLVAAKPDDLFTLDRWTIRRFGGLFVICNIYLLSP